MKFPRQEIGRLLAMSALLLCLDARADWAQSSDVLVVKPSPGLGAVQPQNPPGFTWARHPAGPAQYEVEITLAGAAPLTAIVERNWYLPTSALANGNYSWRVPSARPTGRPRAPSPCRARSPLRSAGQRHVRPLQRVRPRSLPPSFIPVAVGTARMLALEPCTA
jgi:hypothetical protein